MMNNPILEKEDYKVILESLPECDTKVKIDTIIKIIELGEQFEKLCVTGHLISVHCQH